MSSPAERCAAARRRTAHPTLSDFTAELGFSLDPFQVEACEALEEGSGVLVCAPTGAGKTVVGEFAVHRALAEGRKAFYTTPIKALSNQKYNDLVERYGQHKVGLLTGDNAVNGDAPVVVMTTEVLRNMLYADSPAIDGLGYVIMDEVHYLADRFRGAVWEEVIIHLPQSVTLVSLSATVSNAEEFADWLVTVRGDTKVVVSEVRPIPLWQHMLVGNRVFDLFSLRPAAHAGEQGDTPRGHSTRERGASVVDPELARYVREYERRIDSWGGGNGGSRREYGHRPRYRPPSRPDIVERLDRAGLLPAITFVFSRNGCNAAVDQCLRAGLRLTDERERAEIAAIIEERTGSLPEEDLHVLGFWEWREGLLAGLAAHHAGMVPAFKETVEECFVRGLVKAVFATETLALGINMPARTVVLERLVKWNGEAHVDVSPGEYTQLTGRAGRRGIDVEGHAVVVWAPGVDPAGVAGLAGTRTYPLRSSFRPTYNMAVNPGSSFGRARARELLASSFAQFQADRSVVGLARAAARHEKDAERFAAEMHSDRGDVGEYAQLRRRIADREKELSRDSQAKRRMEAADALAALRPGDVIRVPPGRRQGLAVVLDPGFPDPPRPRPARPRPPRAVRAPAGAGRRPRPGDHRPRRPAPARADRGPLGGPPRLGGLPDAGQRAGAGAGAQALQPPQPARPPGPGGHPAQRPRGERPRRAADPPALRRGRRPGAGRPPPGHAQPPGAQAARPGGAGAGRRAVAALGPRGRRPAAQDGRAHRIADPAVRPHLRRPRGARLPGARGRAARAGGHGGSRRDRQRPGRHP